MRDRRLRLRSADGGRSAASARLRALPKGRGVPDGSCVDAEGFVWNAVWEGYRVERFAPDGRLDRMIEVPVAKPTCFAFGGPISTRCSSPRRGWARDDGLAWARAASGGLFAVRPGVKGLPTRRSPAEVAADDVSKGRNANERTDRMPAWRARSAMAGERRLRHRLSRAEAAEGGRAGRHLSAQERWQDTDRLHAAGDRVQLLHRHRRGHQGGGGRGRRRRLHAGAAIGRRHQRPDGHDPGRDHPERRRDHPVDA